MLFCIFTVVFQEMQTKLQEQWDLFEAEREAALGANKKTKTKYILSLSISLNFINIGVDFCRIFY